MSNVSGRMKAVSENAEVFRNLMMQLTGYSYKVHEAKPNFPPPTDHASWYVYAPSMQARSSRYAHDLWKDNQSSIHIESFYLGTIAQWIEGRYGEEGATAAAKVDYSDFGAAKNFLAKKFPAVEKNLRDYERIVSNVSAKHKSNLSIRYEGNRGGAIFYLHAKIDAPSDNAGRNRGQIERVLEALKDAWDSLEDYETKNARESGLG
jgi:hypothetical protein